MNKEFSKSIKSNITYVKPLVGELLSFLQNNMNIYNDDLDDLKLIYNELILNAVIHGNKNNENKFVHIKININNNNIYSSIKDEGSGYDYNKFFDIMKDKKRLLLECGRGMLITNSLTDEISFNDKGNIINFNKRVNCNG